MRTPTPCQRKDVIFLVDSNSVQVSIDIACDKLAAYFASNGERLSWISASRRMCPLNKENKDITSSRDGNSSETP